MVYLLRRIRGNTDEALSGVTTIEQAESNLKVLAESVDVHTLNPSGMSFTLGETTFLYAPIALQDGETIEQACERWNDIQPTYTRPSKRNRSGIELDLAA